MEKKKKKKLWQKILIVFGIVFLFLVGGFLLIAIPIIYRAMTVPGSVRNISKSIEGAVIISNDAGEGSNDTSEQDIQWYNTFDEALQDTGIIEYSQYFGGYRYPLENEIIRFEDEDELAVFYGPTIEEGKTTGTFFCILFHLQEGKFSQPYHMSYFTYERGFEGSLYLYDFGDTVAEFIIYEAAIMGSVSQANGGTPVYYGTWTDKEMLDSLTIQGKYPTEIIPIHFNDATYYFWYYSEEGWTEELSKIDLDDFTLQEVIDVLDIRYQEKKEEE
jgi:hypothetical protein